MLSFLVHILVLGAAIVFGSQAGKKNIESVVVFLNEEMPGGNSGSGIKEIGFQVKKGNGKQETKKKRSEPRNISEKTVNFEKSSKPDHTDTPADFSTVSTANTSTSPASSDGVTTGTSVAGGGSGGSGSGGFGSVGTGGRGGSGGGTGRGHGTGSGDGNALSEQYLADHYAYIRDLIMKHLKYPQLAKKMGWKGKVLVSFIIKENGGVENSRVLTSSGYEILDRNVLSVIKEVQPFPKPPVKAELIIPIAYKLE